MTTTTTTTNATVVRYGMLAKRGRTASSKWRRRFFVLDTQTLTYYKQIVQTYKRHTIEPQGSIRLEDVVAVTRTEGAPEDLSDGEEGEDAKGVYFSIHTKSGRVYYLAAPTPRMCVQWRECIVALLREDGEKETQEARVVKEAKTLLGQRDPSEMQVVNYLPPPSKTGASSAHPLSESVRRKRRYKRSLRPGAWKNHLRDYAPESKLDTMLRRKRENEAWMTITKRHDEDGSGGGSEEEEEEETKSRCTITTMPKDDRVQRQEKVRVLQRVGSLRRRERRRDVSTLRKKLLRCWLNHLLRDGDSNDGDEIPSIDAIGKDASLADALRDGTMLCEIVRRLAPGPSDREGIPSRVHTIAKTKRTAIANLERALRVVYAQGTVRTTSMPRAEDIFASAPKSSTASERARWERQSEIRAHRLLDEIFAAFVSRRMAMGQHLNCLLWYKSVLRRHPLFARPLWSSDGAKPTTRSPSAPVRTNDADVGACWRFALWNGASRKGRPYDDDDAASESYDPRALHGHFRDGSALACVLHSFAGDGGSDACGLPAMRESARLCGAPGGGVKSMRHFRRTKMEVACDAERVFALNRAREVFDLIRAANVRVLFDPEDWVDRAWRHPDFMLLQLDLLRRRLADLPIDGALESVWGRPTQDVLDASRRRRRAFALEEEREEDDDAEDTTKALQRVLVFPSAHSPSTAVLTTTTTTSRPGTAATHVASDSLSSSSSIEEHPPGLERTTTDVVADRRDLERMLRLTDISSSKLKIAEHDERATPEKIAALRENHAATVRLLERTVGRIRAKRDGHASEDAKMRKRADSLVDRAMLWLCDPCDCRWSLSTFDSSSEIPLTNGHVSVVRGEIPVHLRFVGSIVVEVPVASMLRVEFFTDLAVRAEIQYRLGGERTYRLGTLDVAFESKETASTFYGSIDIVREMMPYITRAAAGREAARVAHALETAGLSVNEEKAGAVERAS